MPELIPVLESVDIQRKVADIGAKISEDYTDRDLVLVGVLKGAFIFLSDLVRHIQQAVPIEFVQLSSYGSGTSSSGSVRLTRPLGMDVTGRDVLIVEDIVDTGLSLAFLIDHIKSRGARSVKACAMIDKHERREVDVPVDYVGHSVEKGFLVGYGLDYDELYRGLPGIYHLKL